MTKSGANSITRDDSPCFYRIIYHPDQFEELKIPSEFVKHLTEEAAKTTLIKGPRGKYWNVKLRKDEDGIFFHGGWKKFLMEQHLEGSDFLLFRYDRRMTFHVRIFDKNGLEK
ncbi:putative B3 domain-containing protein Os04g0347400 [Lycium barbarum]|uniref:putative B3 domain-containing protein Os04g0347400 n=1 Tax=Lycium barbarum TaxID=112863 RepID=UPI00293EC382|nr:putative B3 domain-containing protein Os04g0347400 [Lycium barbarum]